ncbi:MAG TPA: heme-binding protein [Candidatus Janibacter merdipullorum]|nr:heme-binding protein [Candidatus Janibacter merdipullorum]
MEHVRASAVLTLAGAGAALDAALAHATEHDLRMNVAVVDPGGVLLSFARMDDAFAASGEIAVDKARTVVRFGGAPTAGLYEALAGEDAVIRGIGNRPGVAAFGGGVPIRVDGQLVGAIGASGGSAEEDAQVAAAGAAAVTGNRS